MSPTKICSRSATPALPDEPEEDDPVVLMYTGGTTGLPKGVLLDQRAEMLNLYHVMQLVAVHGRTKCSCTKRRCSTRRRWAACSAFRRSARCRCSCRCSIPAQAMALIEQHKVTTTVMVPTMIGMMLNHPEFDAERLSSLRTLTYGASPMPAALLDQLLGAVPRSRHLSGLRHDRIGGRAHACSAPTSIGRGDERLRSAGRAVAGVVLSIQDPAGNVLPTGENGEVCAQAGNYMARILEPDRREDRGRLPRRLVPHRRRRLSRPGTATSILVDRVKDMIVTGGENVYSVEVENALASHPGGRAGRGHRHPVGEAGSNCAR